MRKVFAVLVLFFTENVLAQAPIEVRLSSPSDNPVTDRRIQQEAFDQWAIQGAIDNNEAEAATKRLQAADEFYAKAKEFVQLWRAFAAELNTKKTFNAKLAKQVAKAFHDLEKSDGWPVGRQK
jgi:hypothetical protein